MKPLSSLPRLSLLFAAAVCCLGLVAASAPAAAPTLALSAPPVLSGTAQVGQTLQVSTGTWSPTPSSYLYAWHRCNTSGTNCSLSPTSTLSSSYPLTAGDVGFRIVPQIAPDGQWALSVNTSPSPVVVAAPAPSSPPANTVRPVLSGTAEVGQTLQVSTGTWSPAPSSYLYAWHRCNTSGTNCSLSPSSALTSTYLLTAGDVGFRIVPQVAPDGKWAISVNSAPSAVVTAVSAPAPSGPPVNTVRPTLSGTAEAGQTLQVSTGIWSPAPTSYAYAWHRCNSSGTNCSLSPTSGSSPSYLLTAGDVGFRIVPQVAPDGQWALSVNSAPSAVVAAAPVAAQTTPVNSVRPAISGTAQYGQTLQVSTGTWSPAPTSYGYAWHRCSSSGTSCSVSPTSTSSSSYVLGSGDVGFAIVAQVAPNGLWSSSTNSAPSALVTAAAAPVSSTGIAGGTGLYRLGPSWGTGTNYNRFAYSFSGRDDAVRSAQLAGKALVYMAGVDISKEFSTGVDYQTALNNGWLLKDANGTIMAGYGSYLGDVGNPDYQRRWADNVAAFLTQTGADGVYIDDVLSNIATWSDCRCFPTKYPNQAAWEEAMVSWTAHIGPALKSRGFYVVASAHAFIPGNLASNDGTLEVAWWKRLAPYVSGLSMEYWTQSPADPTQIRATGPLWYQQWDGWQQMVSVAQNAGVDFFGLTYGTASTTGLMRYARGSFLLDWHGRGGAVMFEPKDGSDPWNTNWTVDIGQPAGSKQLLAPGVWQRPYSGGSVIVNTNTWSVTVTVAGSPRSIAPTDALILAS